MKGTTGGFLVGVMVGAVAALLAVKLKRGDLPENLEGLADRIQSNLKELENRVQAVVSSSD